MALPADPRTKKAAAPTVVPGGLPPAPTYDIGALLRSLPAYPSAAAYRPAAHASAAAQTAATVRALRAQQAQINQQAALQAQQINQATLAGAGFLSSLGLGDKLQASLNAAAADQRAAASGYSGGLQQTMAGEAARVQQGLNAIGGPGGVPSTAAQAGNVLYGLGGDLPASALEQYAPFAAAAERGRPQQTIGIGQQDAFGALGAGRQEAARLNPDIATAIAGRPALEADILAGLKKDAAAARADAIGNMWKAVQFAQDGNEAEATRLWRSAQLAADRAQQAAQAVRDAERDRISWFNADTSRLNAATSRINANKPSTSGGYSYQDAAGNDYRVGADGKITKLPGAKKPPTGAGKAKISSSVLNRAQTMAEAAAGSTNPLDLEAPPAKAYPVALRQIVAYLHASGVPLKLARRTAKDLLLGQGFSVPPTGKFYNDPTGAFGDILAGFGR